MPKTWHSYRAAVVGRLTLKTHDRDRKDISVALGLREVDDERLAETIGRERALTEICRGSKRRATVAHHASSGFDIVLDAGIAGLA